MKNHSNNPHTPVLLKEVVHAFAPHQDTKFIDATFGFGGHAYELAKAGAHVLGIEKDKDTIAFHTEKYVDRITLVQGTFSQLSMLARQYGFTNVDGVLMDLGISSWQLDESGRGFTFSHDEPLDMRLDTVNTKITAEILINSLSEEELYRIIAKYAECEYAHDIARFIIHTRPLHTTFALKHCVETIVPRQVARSHTARVFQAFRIAVNDELKELSKGLQDAISLLKSKGVLAVISFHSLEDRIVKRSLYEHMRELDHKKPIRPSTEEMVTNPRSKSARMRIAIKL